MTRRSMISRLRSDQRAATALIFGLSIIPLVALGAFAVDFSNAIAVRSRLKAAADAALLTTTQSAITIFRHNALANSANGDFDPAIDDGTRRYYALAGDVSRLGANTDPLIDVQRTGGNFVARIQYQASSPMFFAGVLGALTPQHDGNIPLSGSAEMTISVYNFVDVQMVIDVSGSMLVTADQDLTPGGELRKQIDGQWSDWGTNKTVDGATYRNVTGSWIGQNCAFACHWFPGNDFYQTSRDHGVTLRIDQIKTAASTMADRMNTLSQSGAVPGQYRLGLFTFSVNTDVPYTTGSGWNWYYGVVADGECDGVCQTTPTVNYAPQTDILGMEAVITQIPPTMSDPWHAYNTDITGSVTKFANQFLDMSLDGSTALKPRKFVILMTDGLDDHVCQGPVHFPPIPAYPSGLTMYCDGANRIQLPVQTSACDALHAKNAIVAVLHTALWPGTANYNATQAYAQYNLEQCASASLYYPVDSQASINAAMDAILALATAKPARFTQ